MPNTLTTSAPHGHLDCADTEALLADLSAENERLHHDLIDLARRLDNALAQKNEAIDEAVAARSHPDV